MAKQINIKKGLNISLQGEAVRETVVASVASLYAVTPTDFHGLTPKVVVREGDAVQAGTPLVIDKYLPEINFVSPVSGTVKSVVRGEKRKLLNVIVEADGKNTFVEFPVRDPKNMSADEVKESLLQSGLWPFIKRRPYDVIAHPAHAPKAIYIKGFDTAPLAPDYAFCLKGMGKEIQTAVDAIGKLTSGKVYLSVPAKDAARELLDVNGVELCTVSGPHPAGNLGVIINHTDPINKGETVWCVNALDLVFIGRFFLTGKVDFTAPVAVTGPMVITPAYYRCKRGICLSALFEGNVYKEQPLRYINGNALTGTQVQKDGFLDFYSSQVTVLHEGTNVDELLGWVMPRFNMFSTSRTYFLSGLLRKLNPAKKYDADTRILGGERALIMSGEYDKVFPMDIYPERLLRACLVKDLEEMEALGIYEVVPEDFALCEYVCTSKIEVQKAIRESLDLLKSENGDE